MIEYDGTPFVGWQFQKNGLSIQKVLQDAKEKHGSILSVKNLMKFGLPIKL